MQYSGIYNYNGEDKLPLVCNGRLVESTAYRNSFILLVCSHQIHVARFSFQPNCLWHEVFLVLDGICVFFVK